ncbi:hypothetical protein Q5H92_14945 [Hymenobacter sp. M29]|uniref:Uncharacterized protein n=1 Tax=Hymenobacter mellowenesis TaxID=3063995 RepID=A0ABT9ACT3_9BACT|nr:hypothetical protein [Hymenobacter sp. M29]MDO7847664.1 hypothetical protein [Hymenobacter sp. M29]
MESYKVEVLIVEALVNHCLAAGYSLSVDDGGDEFALVESTSREGILEVLMNTGADTVVVYDQRGQNMGFVDLVYGNEDWTVMCNWAMSLDSFLEPIHQLSQKFEEEVEE